jgi:catechol 2,3-dioxygenase-like lactoylglutathione lyase family enzyme
MAERVVAMIHVPDVRATVEWYTSIGFKVITSYEDGDEMSFAILSFGGGEVMFNAGGEPSTRDRREVDLYVQSDDVVDLHRRLKDGVEIVEGLHDTFYGMREFIIRDINRFWITFGQPVTRE